VHKVVLFGGDNNVIHKLDQQGTVTRLNNAPIPLGIYRSVTTVDPVSGKYLILGANRSFYEFDVMTDTWRVLSGTVPSAVFSALTPPIFDVIAAPVSTHGVVMFVTANATNSKVHIYKHAAGAAAPPTSPIPSALGWYHIPNTKISPLCPAGVPGATGCQAVTGAWNGAVMDTTRNRFMVWGGGHNDYYGNEIYSLDLNTLQMTRLTNPGQPYATSCAEAIAGGAQPNSRHTYNLIDYLPNVDRMFVWGGSLACAPGTASGETWQFNPGALSWQRMNQPLANRVSSDGWVAAYDPNSGRVFLWNHGDGYLYAYDPSANSWKQLPNSYGQFDYHMSPVVDPVRKRLYVFGHNEQWMYDISAGSAGSSYPRQNANTTGGAAFLANDSPGLAYDSAQDRIVGWDGGNTVWLLNPATGAWTSQTHAGGPAAMSNGTFGRFRYVPALNLFVTCNSISADCSTLRLTP
jgi:hypothetical protein